jgi:two-component system LytT family response regulator
MRPNLAADNGAGVEDDMKYRAVLVEDEPLALQRLERLLGAHAEKIEVVGSAQDGLAAAETIRVLRPDVVFLDIQMPGLDGFEVLKRLDRQPWIIFCTAYDEYALRAFETHSVDYLLKPIEPERLSRAIEKLVCMTRDGKDEVHQNIERLLAGLPSMPTRLRVQSGDRFRLLPLNEIYYLRAADKYVEVHTYDETHLMTESLSQLEQRLPSQDFVRIHRAAIVNLAHLDEIFRWFSGGYRVRMRDKARTELDVSRSGKSRLGL